MYCAFFARRELRAAIPPFPYLSTRCGKPISLRSILGLSDQSKSQTETGTPGSGTQRSTYNSFSASCLISASVMLKKIRITFIRSFIFLFPFKRIFQKVPPAVVKSGKKRNVSLKHVLTVCFNSLFSILFLLSTAFHRIPEK